MGQAGRPQQRRGGGTRTAAARRRRRPARRRLGLGGVVGTVAVGLVVLSAPATSVAAHVAATWSPFRTGGTSVATAPPVAAAVPQYPAVPVPEPVVEAPALAVPVPGRIEVELPNPMVPHGQVTEFEPPPATCGGYGNPRRIPPGVVPGAGSATISWQADGRTDVLGYRVQAVSQQLVTGQQPAPVQVEVAQRDDCGPVEVVVGGLTPGVPYVFWLEELVRDRQTEVTRYLQVGTSDAVTVG
ncbi:hypothetical protein [Blastococcus sp. SYSU D00820]